MFDALSAADLDRDTVVGATADELFALVRDIHARRQQLDLAEAMVLAEIDRRDVTDRELGLRTPAWLARETAVPPSVAKKRVKVATMLQRWFPAFADALADGRIGWDHARLVCDVANHRIVDQIADLQESLLELAAGVGFDPWAQQVRALAELLDQDGGHDPHRDLERNQLSYTRTTDGILHLRGMLVGELGLTFDQALTATTDTLALRYAHDHERCPDIAIPSRTSLQALALIELLRRAAGVDIASSSPPVAEIVMRIEATDPATKTDLDRVRIQDGTLRALLCDADLYALVVNSLGEPLDLGRRVRYANEHQRRAFRERDGGCIFPGCDAPARWCDVHHQIPWDKGGRTHVRQMALLCRHHHRVTHRPGWRLDVTPDQWFHWTTPNGVTFWSQRHGRQHAGPAPPADGTSSTACCN